MKNYIDINKGCIMKKNTDRIKQLSYGELAFFFKQLHMILKSGMNVEEGLLLMLENAVEGNGKIILKGLYDRYEVNGSLGNSLEECNLFPKYAVNLIKIAEFSGELDNILEKLSIYYEKEDELDEYYHKTIKYPFFLVLLVFIIVMVLAIKVFPVFSEVYESLGIPLSGINYGIMSIVSYISTHYIVLVLVCIVMALIGLYKIYGMNSKERKGHQGRLSQIIECHRFALSLSLMLKTGLSIEKSLEMGIMLSESDDFKNKIKQCETSLNKGEGIEKSFLDAELFDNMKTKLLITGIKTGNSAEILEKISELYEKDVDIMIYEKIDKLEPLLVIVFSTIIGGMLLSIMLPLLNIVSMM